MTETHQIGSSGKIWVGGSESVWAMAGAYSRGLPKYNVGVKKNSDRRLRPQFASLKSRNAIGLYFIAVLVILFFGFSVFFYGSVTNYGAGVKQSVDTVRKPLKESNLNKLDMPTHMVKGVREPCLQLLSEMEIENLELPPSTETSIKDLRYLGGSMNFSGDPSPLQRLSTFQVKETMEVHCGWCSEGGGFDIDIVDKAFMDTCRVVIQTCAFGGGDNLHQPIGQTDATAAKVCYVAFWDEVTLKQQEQEGVILGPDRRIGLWHIVLVHNLPFVDQRRNGKIPKMLSHRLFTNARYSIWVDSKSQFRRDPIAVLQALLWVKRADFAISEHGARSCVYKEGVAIVQKHKATPEEVAMQLDAYRSEGMPEDARVDGHKALAEASIIIREHNAATNLFMCAWFNEVVRFTARDQLSFPYVLIRLPVLHLHMFPVCTRKALVNSLGHQRKAQLYFSRGDGQ